VKLAAGWSDMGRLRLGAYGRGTHQVVPIPDCLAATPTLRRAMAVISHLVIERELEPWDPESGQGWLRHVVLRQSRSSGKVLATLVVGRAGGPVRGLGHAFMESMGEVCGVHLHINDQPGNAIFASPAPDEEPGARFQIVGGAHTLIEELNGVKVGIGAGDFFQTNPAMASRIFSDIVADFAELKDRPVVDLYCGVGALTLQLARQHGWALGAEVVPGAVERAAENALLNHLPARFLGGPVAELLPQIEEATRGRAPLVVVDPARRGLEEGVIADLLRLEPALIAYLSCNPRALARDLSLLLAQGWKLRSLRAYDMFPQTAHVETLAMLEPPVAPSPTTRAPQRRIVRAV
jgi:23S rRNA (uracil1939-C5)-methyltransferase